MLYHNNVSHSPPLKEQLYVSDEFKVHVWFVLGTMWDLDITDMNGVQFWQLRSIVMMGTGSNLKGMF